MFVSGAWSASVAGRGGAGREHVAVALVLVVGEGGVEMGSAARALQRHADPGGRLLDVLQASAYDLRT